MASIGRRVTLPANTDPTKTYAYRAIKKFVGEVSTWNVDLSIIKSLIKEIVYYGKKHGLLSKGTSLLNMRSVLKICYEYLQREVNKTEILISNIERSNQFIRSKVGNNIDVLVSKHKRDGYTNFTQWFRAGNISPVFISISSVCMAALYKLPADERNEFPDDILLLRMRIHILSDKNLRAAAERILGRDLITTGVLMESDR
ncbi:MAG: hypothetical protein QXP41_00265 [Candidatus Nitrosocaldus sp.]